MNTADLDKPGRMPVLDAGMTVDAALQAIGRDCLAEFRMNAPKALSGEVEAVHDMRVAIRRLRSALSAVKPMLAPRQYRWATTRLKWLADQLGLARNWDVFTDELLTPLLAVAPAGYDVQSLIDAAERHRAAASRKMVEALRSARYAATLEAVTQWFEDCGWRRDLQWPRDLPLGSPIGTVVPPLLDRLRRRVRKLGRVFETLSDEERHRLRIALKKLRYTVELFAGLFDGEAVSAYLRLLKPAQEALGLGNDISVASGLIARLRPADDCRDDAIVGAEGFLLGWHRRGLAEGETALRKQIKKVGLAQPCWR